MSATTGHPPFDIAAIFPNRYKSLLTLLALTVLGSLSVSNFLLPSRLERVATAVERGDQALISHELALAATQPVDPGEARTLVDVALTLGNPEAAAAILQRFLAAQPSSVDGLRLLTEVQRQRHQMLDVATLDERVYALTGDADALRESADIYGSRHLVPQRIEALRRLAAIDRATGADIAELAHRLTEGGERAAALALVLTWLESPRPSVPAELLGLAAGMSADLTDASDVATRLGVLVGRSGQIGLLHVLIQTYAERERPALSLVAGRALGAAMTARPDVALTLAQLEALQHEFAAARARLDALDRAGTLLPAGLPMLAELSTQAGDLERAVAIVGSLAVTEIPEGMPHRLVEAIDVRGDTSLLARIPLEAIAASSPASAAAVALARGDRGRAKELAAAALAPGGDPDELGPAFGRVVHALGLEHAAVERLLTVAHDGALDDGSLVLLLDLAATARADASAIREALRAQRDRSPRAGIAWAMLAARQGQSVPVVAWLATSSPGLPAQTLLDLLLLAVEHGQGGLAEAAAASLAARTDLPSGWTKGEIALTARSREPITLARLQNALDLIGSPATSDAARDRVAALLVAAPGSAPTLPLLAQTAKLESRRAIAWLENAAGDVGSPDRVAIRLELLAALSPQQALGLLGERVNGNRTRLLPIYIAALARAGRTAQAEAELRIALRNGSAKQGDTVMYETLARLRPDDTLAFLREAAATGRPGWQSAYEDKLARAGKMDELRAYIRTQAAAVREPARQQSLAARLVELNDRDGAILVLKTLAAGKPPTAPAVEQLMYLWGPRAAPEAIAWTRDQALAAPLGPLAKWMEHLAYLGDPGAAVSVIDHRRGALSGSAAVVRAYGAALLASHASGKPDLREAVAAATAPEVLIALARLALDTTQPASAWQAARAAVNASPTDPEALLLAAEAAAVLRRSDDAATLYLRLLATGPQSVDVCVDAADALLTAKRFPDGRRLLQATLARLPSKPATLAQARMRARTLLLLARDDDARALLSEWLVRYPHHAGLQADLMQARLDQSVTR